MRFVDFLRTTVLLSAGAATALGAVSVLASATGSGSDVLRVGIDLAWWAIAGAVGLLLGRRAQTTPPIARLLTGARSSTLLPEYHPSAILINRLWPLALFTMLAGALAFLAPQIPGIAAGFAIIWTLAWRRQDAAVAAVEERDGVTFYVQRTSPLRPISLVRSPGLRASRPQRVNGTVR